LHIVSIDDELHDLREVPPPTCEKLQRAFAEHDARLERMKQRHKEKMVEMRTEWGEEGSEQHTHVTQQFLPQLRDDPICAIREKPEKSHF